MKKLLLLASLAFLAVTTTSTTASAQAGKFVKAASPYEKSTTGTWIGIDRLYYKLNAADKTVWSSVDGTTGWNQIKSGIWNDKNGKWIKVEGTKLIWSADQGINWRDLPEGTWEAGDGKFHRFNASWQLLVKK